MLVNLVRASSDADVFGSVKDSQVLKSLMLRQTLGDLSLAMKVMSKPSRSSQSVTIKFPSNTSRTKHQELASTYPSEALYEKDLGAEN